MYGWYSETQKAISKEIIKKRMNYIYYIDMSNNIVEVTEVSKGEKYPSFHKDVVSLGPLKEFYKATNEPIELKKVSEFP